MSGARWPVALLLVCGLGAVEVVRVDLRSETELAAPRALLRDVAVLGGSATVAALVGSAPVQELFGLGSFRIDAATVRRTVRRVAPGVEVEVRGEGRVRARPRSYAPGELAAAARGAVQAGDQGELVECTVVRHPQPITVPDLGSEPMLLAERLDPTQESGEMPVRVRILRGDTELGRVLVGLSVRRWRDHLVLAAPVPRGRQLEVADLLVQRVEVTPRLRGGLTRPEEALGQLAARDLAEGLVLTRDCLQPKPEVEAGRTVTLLWRRDAIELAAPGTALGSGRSGDLIQVRRATDHQVVRAQILDEGRVLVNF